MSATDALTITSALDALTRYYDAKEREENAVLFLYINDAYLEALNSLEKLEAENAKLRELVVEVFECARRGAACETCKVNNDGYACVYIMRELGVEVEE